MNETDEQQPTIRRALDDHSTNGEARAAHASGTRQKASSRPILPEAPRAPRDRPRPTVQLPGADCDVLRGLAQIALWLGITEGQAREDIRRGLIPTHRAGPGKGVVYAFKSEINQRYRTVLLKAAAQ